MASPRGSRESALVGLSTASWKGADPSKPQDDSVSKGKKVDWEDVEARARMEGMRLIRWRKEQGSILPPPTPCRSRQPPKKRRREHGARQEEDITAPVAKAPRCELGMSGDLFDLAGASAIIVPEARAWDILSDEPASSSADEDEAEAEPDTEVGASPMRVDPNPDLCPETDSTTGERKAEANELEGVARGGSPAGQRVEAEAEPDAEVGASPMRVDSSPDWCPETDSTTGERKAEANELEGVTGGRSSAGQRVEAEVEPDAEVGASPMRVDSSPDLCPETDSTTGERKAEANELEGVAGDGSSAGQCVEVEYEAGGERAGSGECGGSTRLEETDRRSAEGAGDEIERCAVVGPELERERGCESRELEGASEGKADVAASSAPREESVGAGQPAPGEECGGTLPCAARGTSGETEQKDARDEETNVAGPCDARGSLEDMEQRAAGEAIAAAGPGAARANLEGMEQDAAVRAESEEADSCTASRDVGDMESGAALGELEEETGQGPAGGDMDEMRAWAPGLEMEMRPQSAVGQDVEKPELCAVGLEKVETKKLSDADGGVQEAERGSSERETFGCARSVEANTLEEKEVSVRGERAKVEPAGENDSTDGLDACVGCASRPKSLPAEMLVDGSAVHDEHLSTPFPSPAYLGDGGPSETSVSHSTPRTVSTMPPSPPVSDLTDSMEIPRGFATESVCDRHESPCGVESDGDSDALDLLARLALKRTASDASSSSGSEMATADPMRLPSALATRCSTAHAVHGGFLEDRGNEEGEKTELEQWRGLGTGDEEGATPPCLELPPGVEGGLSKDSHPEKALAPESDPPLAAATRSLSFLSQAAAATAATAPTAFAPIPGGVTMQGSTPETPAIPESLDGGHLGGHLATPIVCPASASELGVPAFRGSGLLPHVSGSRCPPPATRPSSSEITPASALSALLPPTEGEIDAAPSKTDDESTSLGPPAGSRTARNVSDGVGVVPTTSAAGYTFVDGHGDVLDDASSTTPCTGEAPRRVYLPPIPRLPGFSGIGANATRWSYESSGWMRSPHSQWWRPAKGLCALLEAGVLCEAEGFTRRLTMSLAESSAARPGRSYGEAGIGPAFGFAVEHVRLVRRRAPRKKRETHVLVADDDLKEGANSVWRGLEEAAKAEAKALLNARKSGLLEAETDDNRHWVRRSVRAAGSSALDSPNVVKVLEMIRSNHSEVEVLKLHHYLSADVNSGVIEAVLDALMTNDNCQALYIQDFNEGIRDEQVRKLAQVLRRGNIWCLNAGENYKVSLDTWWFFVEEVKETHVTHAYLSEHVITPELKNAMRDAIRANRRKHTRHKSFDNLDVIRRCTNMWWNPINSRELQAEMKRRNVSYEELVLCVPTGSTTLPRVPCSLHDGKEVTSYSISTPDFPAFPPAAEGLQPP